MGEENTIRLQSPQRLAVVLYMSNSEYLVFIKTKRQWSSRVKHQLTLCFLLYWVILNHGAVFISVLHVISTKVSKGQAHSSKQPPGGGMQVRIAAGSIIYEASRKEET